MITLLNVSSHKVYEKRQTLRHLYMNFANLYFSPKQATYLLLPNTQLFVCLAHFLRADGPVPLAVAALFPTLYLEATIKYTGIGRNVYSSRKCNYFSEVVAEVNLLK